MNEGRIPWRVQLWFVAACYGAVLAFAAAMITQRYFAGLRSPDDFNGGMAAFGDWMMELNLAGMLLVPTFLLAFLIRHREDFSARFSKVLLGFSVTGPISLGALLIPAVGQTNSLFGSLCLCRLSGAPIVLIGLVGSWLLARFKRSRRLIAYAFLIELLTMTLLIASLFFSMRGNRG
ncbi:MAG: hypothetical protein WAL71_14375 [Terriglobales bacterium]|jgi:hypothetical protein